MYSEMKHPKGQETKTDSTEQVTVPISLRLRDRRPSRYARLGHRSKSMKKKIMMKTMMAVAALCTLASGCVSTQTAEDRAGTVGLKLDAAQDEAYLNP